MSVLLKDLQFAARLLRRSPGFTFVAVLSLALGIGANTAIFSLVNAVLLRPMPVKDAGSLVSVFQTDERNPGNIPVSHLNFKDLRDRNSVFTDMTAVSFTLANLVADEQSTARQIPIQIVAGNYFDVLGVRMLAGRGFAPDEDSTPGAHPVTVISWPFWQKQFAGDPHVVGRTITFNRVSFTVIGVTPRSFDGTFALAGPQAWVPMAMHAEAQPEITWYEGRRGLFLFPVGRLKPGVTLDQARSNLQAVMANLEREFPNDNKGRSAAVLPLLDARVNPNGQGQILLLSRLLLAIVAIILLIACANLANLLLARASRRQRELAVRLAIGANRSRVVRQLLTESVLLACLGGVVGLGLAYAMFRVLVANPTVLPFPIDDAGLALDPTVLFYTAVLSVATGLLFGLAPALQASRRDLIGTIKQETLPSAEGRGRLRKTLVVAQVALSVISLVAAGLFLRSLGQMSRIDPGFRPANVTALAVNLGREGYTPERGATFYRDFLDRAGTMPGVDAVAVTQGLPLGGAQFQRSVFLDSQDTTGRDRKLVAVNPVSPGFFATVGIPMVRGRDFDTHDEAQGPKVAIVNETMAKQLWPGQDALNQRFRFFGDAVPTEVVGIVRDSKINGLDEDPTPFVYEPLSQNYASFGWLVARTATSAPAAGDLRRVVQGLDPGLSVLNVRTLTEQVDLSMTGQRTLTTLLGVFGMVALLLASLGLYGVASYWVGMRTREIGVRMALGAKPTSMMVLVLRQSMIVVAVGVFLGLAVALFAGVVFGSQLATFLVRVNPTDPRTLAGTVGILTLVAVLACLVPARRAARIDPLLALRQD